MQIIISATCCRTSEGWSIDLYVKVNYSLLSCFSGSVVIVCFLFPAQLLPCSAHCKDLADGGNVVTGTECKRVLLDQAT